MTVLTLNTDTYLRYIRYGVCPRMVGDFGREQNSVWCMIGGDGSTSVWSALGMTYARNFCTEVMARS